MSELRHRPSLWPAVASLSIFTVVMAMVLGSGCYRPTDTYPNYRLTTSVTSTSVTGGAGGTGGASDMGGMGGVGGSGAGDEGGSEPQVFVDPEDYFNKQVLNDLVTNCAKTCHISGTETFLVPGDEYASLMAYRADGSLGLVSFLVKDFTTSVLLTYPSTEDHSGPKWFEEEVGDLKERVTTWLEMEAKNLPDQAFLEVGPFLPSGLTSIPLDGLGFAGSKMTFYATAYGDPVSLLELNDISVHPANGVGLRIDDITLVVLKKDALDGPGTLDTSLHGDPVDFVAPNLVNIAEASRPAPDKEPTIPDHLFITSWEPGAKLKVRVDSIEALLVDELGGLFPKCKQLAAFTAAVDSLPIQFDDSGENGPMFCAQYCHGAATPLGGMPTPKMSLASLLASPRNDELACAKMLPFIAASDALIPEPELNLSPIIVMTKPGNATAHPYQFQGNSGSHAGFAAKIVTWIDAELPPVN